MGHKEELKHLLDLEDNQLKMYLETIDNPNLHIIMLNKQPSTIQLLPYRPITPYGENIYRVSVRPEAHEKRNDALTIVKKDDQIPTLKARKWLFHEDGREFSLREYAQVQEFPDEFIFVGSYDEIKQQIGNAVAPPMASFIARQIPKSNAISLFSGAGGMDLGFQQVGHNVMLSTDWDVNCAYTHRANFPKIPFLLKDVKTVTLQDIQENISCPIDLVFGGPPCQGFSVSGLRFKDDPRNELYKEFLHIVELTKAHYFVMENVMGILTFKEQIVEDMNNSGYEVDIQIIKGEEIGMRQKRHRVFFMGEAYTGKKAELVKNG
jgi:site-specific DNA-cytosine methylase